MSKDKIASFTDLIAWKKGHALVLAVYRLSAKFPREELFGLTNQRDGVQCQLPAILLRVLAGKEVKRRGSFMRWL